MRYALVRRPQKRVIGIFVRTTNENGQIIQDTQQLWGRFLKEKIQEKIPNRVGGDIFALYTQYEEDYTKPYTYVLGCEVSSLDQIPKGMMGIEISPTPYAVFTARGAFPASLGSTWQSIWETPIERAYSVDFEIYPPTFHPESNPEVKVFIAVK